MSSEEFQSKRRLHNLDALRAIACFLVLWEHVGEVFYTLTHKGAWIHTVSANYEFGRAGVIAFFCISGFVIPSSLRGKRMLAARNFLLKRFFRLYPLFWLSIPFGLMSEWVIRERAISLDLVMKNMTMLPTAFGATSIIGLYWTLEIELLFYICCLLLYLVFGHLGARLSWATSLFFLSCHKFHNSSPLNLNQAFMFGSLMFLFATLRHILDQPTEERPKRRLLLCLWLASLVLWFTPNAYALSLLRSGSLLAFLDYSDGSLLGVSLFFLFLAFKNRRGRLAQAGEASYFVYLFHPTIFYTILAVWLVYHLEPLRLEFYLVLVTFCVFQIATLAFKYVEKPAMNFAKKHLRESSFP